MSLILLVEDVEDNRELARFLLEADGHEVVEAKNGLEALAMARESRPDLVLMDLSLPEMDGWEAARRLWADPQTADLTIVAITAHAMSGDRERVLGAGFKGYVAKPIDVTAFAEQIRGFIA